MTIIMTVLYCTDPHSPPAAQPQYSTTNVDSSALSRTGVWYIYLTAHNFAYELEFNTNPIVLLFNKFDLLEQRVKENPIEDYYPEYPEDSDPWAACRFFAAKFSELDRRPHGSLRVLRLVR